MKIFVLTDIPSPYQTEIFNEIADTRSCELHVAYLRSADPARQWSGPDIRHESTKLDLNAEGVSQARNLIKRSDLTVFNYYRHRYAEQLLSERANTNRPWCFWGERPGFRKPEWVGRLLRYWKLRPLHESDAPIWGIGKFAVDQYRTEFGLSRSYFNLPYFSNLKRFECSKPPNRELAERVFVYSGSLTHRKGVDILARAFVALVREGHNVKLRIIGDGPLRSKLRRELTPAADRVDFVGFIDWQNLPQQYAMGSFLCVPSRYDGWGLVVPEGLASGLPVIATDQMGAGLEFIESGYNGWLIPANNRNALLSAMRDAASLSQEDLSRVSSNARKTVDKHTLQDGAHRFLDYASETVGSWKS